MTHFRWLALGLLGIAAQAQGADTFNSNTSVRPGNSLQDCYQRAERPLYVAQLLAQAEVDNAERDCEAHPATARECSKAAQQRQRDELQQARQKETDAIAQCRIEASQTGSTAKAPVLLKGGVEMNVPAATGRPPGPSSYPAPTAIASPTPLSPSPTPAAAPERWVSGTDPQGFPIWVRVTKATPGVAYTAQLSRVSDKSNSPWTSAYGIYDGTNFIVQSLNSATGSHKLQTPLQLAPALSPYTKSRQ